ncbi:MAG: hypothetical protein CBC91_02980 [Rickettsiales bacterium TMED131]|nr:MAG: hypothetical protein CBC91_02980 [Rickettsiales bacterium TMED131]
MSNYTQLGFVKQTDGENIGTWGDVLNDSLIDLLDDAIGGYVEVSVASGNVTLAFADGTADNNGRHAVIKFTGSPGTTRTVTFPNKQKTYYINNGSDGSVICTAGSGAATVTIPTSKKTIIYVDGSDEIHSMYSSPALADSSITNDMLAGSIADSKLSTISTAGKVDIGALEIDGATDIGADLADADLIIVDDGAGGTERKAAMSRVATYVQGGISGDITISSGTAAIGSGVIVNADVNASAAIADSKLATISTADKVSGAAVQVDGATDGTSITVADSDKFLIDDGGTTKYINASQLNTYVSAESSSVAADNISTGDAAVTIGTSSGDITLDSPSNIILDADGGGFEFKDGGTQILGITNSSGDVIIGPVVDAKDLIFQQRDGTEVARIEDNASFNISASGSFAINGTTVTSTAAELNIMDGGTAASSTTLADADRLVTNDAGTMKQVALTDLKTYLTSAGFSSEDPTALAIALG